MRSPCQTPGRAYGGAAGRPRSAETSIGSRCGLPPFAWPAIGPADPGAEAVGNGQASVGRYYADTGDSPAGGWAKAPGSLGTVSRRNLRLQAVCPDPAA